MHVQLTFPGRDAFLKHQLSVEPRHRQRRKPPVDVYHAMPGQMSRTGEIVADRRVGEAELTPHLVPDAFLAGDGKRQIDAVERHPVDEVFPFVPSPPWHGVTVSAVVQEEAVLDPGLNGDRLGYPGRDGRELKGIRLQPAYLHMAIVFHVVVQRRGHGVGVVAADYYFPAFRLKAEDIGLAVYLLKREGVLIAWEHSMHKAPDGGDVVAVGAENVHDTE